MKRILNDTNTYNKSHVNSLFCSGGTLEKDDLKNAYTFNILESVNYLEKIIYSRKVHVLIKNEHIQIIDNNNFFSLKIIKDFEFTYKIQKTQVKCIDIEKLLNDSTFGIIFIKKLIQQNAKKPIKTI